LPSDSLIMSVLAVHNFEDAGLSTPTRFLMEYYENPLTPSIGSFAMAETNPFEYSFRPNNSAKPEPTIINQQATPIPTQLPPTPASSAHSSPRQSVHNDNASTEQLMDVTAFSPKIHTRSRNSVKREAESYSQKRKLDEEEDEVDSEEKRRKFLERNRQAASKCRQKKKAWMQDLEQRSEEIISRNKSLHETVSMLKEEVLFLKNQLLAHRGCDCTVVKNYIQTSGTFSSFLGNNPAQRQPTTISNPIAYNPSSYIGA